MIIDQKQHNPLTTTTLLLTIGVFALSFWGSCGGKKSEAVEEVEDYYTTIKIPKKPEPVVDANASLWGNTETAELFLPLDSKAKGLNDLVTVVITEESEALKEAGTVLKRSSGQKYGVPNLGGIMSSISGITPASIIEAESKNNFDGSGETSRSDSLKATMTVRVVNILPNGNFVIKGKRKVHVNGETQVLTLKGVIRPQDIQIDNSIPSKFVADADISYSGKGIIGDKQRPGWLARILDWVWPF